MRSLRIVLALGLMLGPVVAQAAAGQVLFALGRVEIQRGGQSFVAQRGTPVEVGDAIATGPTGLAQVRLKDGALLSLRYGSTMVVEEFRLPAAAPAAPVGAVPTAPATTSVAGRSVLRLLRGAFRTVTGLIGRNASDAYSVVTPVATIGIRGTDYSAAYCSGDCGTTPDGLYVGVSSGEIELNNDGGQLVLTNDQYGYVKDSSTPPDQELAPPEVLETPIEAPEEEEEFEPEGETPAATDEAAPESGFAEETKAASVADVGETQPEGDYELLPGQPGSYAFSVGNLRGSGDNGVYTDDSGALIGFLTDGFTSIGTSQNVNLGADAETGLRWGRWSGGVANFGDSALDLSSTSLHWIYAEAPAATALPISGTASYTLIGNTDPTDTLGNVGFLGDAQLSANFTNQTVSSTLNIGINSEVWLASGSGSIASGTPLFSGSYTLNVNDALGSPIDTGTGGFDGFFTSGAIGAGLSFSLSSSTATVSGAAAFAAGGP